MDIAIVAKHVTGCLFDWTIWASIRVTRSYSSDSFLCTLACYLTYFCTNHM